MVEFENSVGTHRQVGGLIQLLHLAELLVGFLMLYSLVMRVVNRVAVLASGAAGEMTKQEALAATPVAAPGVTIVLPDPLAEVLIACIVLGVITYVVLKWLCHEEWVQEPVQVEECWEEVKWYNPWSWVVAVVCTVKEVLKWVLKQICGWVEVLVSALVIVCIVVGIIIIFL